MNLAEYTKFTRTTAKYPGAMSNSISALNYTILGLVGESGELANLTKKIYRDDQGILTVPRLTKMYSELGDVLWYLVRFLDDQGMTLEDLADINHKKLSERMATDSIKGSGEDRVFPHYEHFVNGYGWNVKFTTNEKYISALYSYPGGKAEFPRLTDIKMYQEEGIGWYYQCLLDQITEIDSMEWVKHEFAGIWSHYNGKGYIVHLEKDVLDPIVYAKVEAISNGDIVTERISVGRQMLRLEGIQAIHKAINIAIQIYEQ